MKWDNNVFCYIVSNIKKELYRSEEMTYDFLDDGLILQLYVCGEKHLLSKWKNRIAFEDGFKFVVTQKGFPLSDIIEAIHSYSDALKEYILNDDRKWEDDCRDEVLSWLAEWESSFDIDNANRRRCLCYMIGELDTVKDDYLKHHDEVIEAFEVDVFEGELFTHFFKSDKTIYTLFIKDVMRIYADEKIKRKYIEIVQSFAYMLDNYGKEMHYFRECDKLYEALCGDRYVRLECPSLFSYRDAAKKAKLSRYRCR